MANRPDVVSGDGIYTIEHDISLPRRVRAGDNTPIAAIPMLDECLPDVLRRSAGMRREAYRPHVIRGDHCHPVELIPVRASANIRTGNDFPGSIDGGCWTCSWGDKGR